MVEYKLNCEENSSIKVYGIVALQYGKTIKTIDCITDNFEDADKLVNLLNSLKIEVCHFENIIEDYLTDFCI